MLWRPRIDYGTETLLFELSQQPWEPDDESVGGADISAGRKAAAFEIRHDHRMRIRLRFSEYEMADVAAWFRYAQQFPNIGFTYWFDQTDEYTSFPVFLCDPLMGAGKFNPRREGNIPIVFVLECTIMTLDGSAMPVEYFTEEQA